MHMVLVCKTNECLNECKCRMSASAYFNELDMLVKASWFPLNEKHIYRRLGEWGRQHTPTGRSFSFLFVHAGGRAGGRAGDQWMDVRSRFREIRTRRLSLFPFWSGSFSLFPLSWFLCSSGLCQFPVTSVWVLSEIEGHPVISEWVMSEFLWFPMSS